MKSSESDAVWISREEYERLRASAGDQAAVPMAAPVVSSLANEPAKKSNNASALQTTTGVVLAIGLIISMSSDFLNWIAVPILVVFAIFAVISLIDYFRNRRRREATFATYTNDTTSTKSLSPLYKTLLVMGVLILALPILVPVAFVVLIMIIMGTSGGSAGS